MRLQQTQHVNALDQDFALACVAGQLSLELDRVAPPRDEVFPGALHENLALRLVQQLDSLVRCHDSLEVRTPLRQAFVAEDVVGAQEGWEWVAPGAAEGAFREGLENVGVDH